MLRVETKRSLCWALLNRIAQHGTILFSNIQHVEWKAKTKHEVIIDSGGKKSSHHLSFVVSKPGGGGGGGGLR